MTNQMEKSSQAEKSGLEGSCGLVSSNIQYHKPELEVPKYIEEARIHSPLVEVGPDGSASEIHPTTDLSETPTATTDSRHELYGIRRTGIWRSNVVMICRLGVGLGISVL